jgi:hypothetical protein
MSALPPSSRLLGYDAGSRLSTSKRGEVISPATSPCQVQRKLILFIASLAHHQFRELIFCQSALKPIAVYPENRSC